MEPIDLEKIYQLNLLALQKFNNDIEKVGVDKALEIPYGETWSLQMVAEHITLVETGVLRLISSLIKDVDADTSELAHSENFINAGAQREEKLDAPIHARPTGEVSIQDCLAKLTENNKKQNEIKEIILKNGVGAKTFPHPYFGEFNALDWFALLGHHRIRHRRQIKRIISAFKSDRSQD